MQVSIGWPHMPLHRAGRRFSGMPPVCDSNWCSVTSFHALGTSRLIGGTVCDTCAEAAWDATVGPIGGADPESVEHSDLVVAWGADLMTVNVHFWAKLEAARARGTQLVVIEPRVSRTAKAARTPTQTTAPT